jgi:SAM-dependent methyltransferase
MHDRGKKIAPDQVAEINLENVNSVLDVGGGSGVFCMAFLNRKPELKTAIFDLPNVVPISERIIKKEGYTGRIELFKGDFNTDDLPKGFDLIFLSAIIHINSSEINQKLLNKCYKALNPGGKIVIQDWIMNDNKTSPLQGAIFAINMLVGTENGDCYSENEVGSWLANAGFSDIRRIKIESGVEQMLGIKK